MSATPTVESLCAQWVDARSTSRQPWLFFASRF